MRKITIVETGTNKRTIIDTEATTVGELLAAMDEKKINYRGMTLFEGISNAEYSVERPDAILPHDLPWKGGTTNNLAFLLTQEKKNIASGMSRAEVFQLLKDNDLVEDANEHFGRHYTNVSTEDLLAFIEENTDDDTEENELPECASEEHCEGCIINAILALTAFLAIHGHIKMECMVAAMNDLKDEVEKAQSDAGEAKLPEDLTEDDLTNMLERMRG